MLRKVVCILALLSASVLAAQDSSFKDMQPTGIAHRVALAAAIKEKIELAYSAVLDVEELADVDVYRPENLDAKRAIRTATVAATDKGAKDLMNDIEMIRLTKETCRSMNTVSDFDACRSVEKMWVNRVRVKLGKPPIKED